MVKVPECDRCQLYAHNPHLICTVHPTEVDSEKYPDFQADPNAALEKLCEPVGASYYNRELIHHKYWIVLAVVGRMIQCKGCLTGLEPVNSQLHRLVSRPLRL
jgi:hypothetical protein